MFNTQLLPPLLFFSVEKKIITKWKHETAKRKLTLELNIDLT